MNIVIITLSFAAGVAASFLIPKAWAKLKAWLVVKLS